MEHHTLHELLCMNTQKVLMTSIDFYNLAQIVSVVPT